MNLVQDGDSVAVLHQVRLALEKDYSVVKDHSLPLLSPR